MSKAPGLLNRRRVWGLARTLDHIVETQVKNHTCSGTIVHSYFEPAAPEEDDGIWSEAHRCLRPFNQSFTTGCRELFVRSMVVPQNASNIHVSVVDILGKTYVSGIRFEGSRGIVQQIGYVRPGNETTLIWDAQSEPLQATGLHLALDQHGVRGLCVVSGAKKLSGWAGQHENIPKRRLVVPLGKEDGITALKGGFDVSFARSLTSAFKRH